jgi:hypothetical protein
VREFLLQPKCVGFQSLVFVHFYRQLWFLRVNETVLSLRELPLFDIVLGLVEENGRQHRGHEFLGHLDRRMVVPNMFIHIDSLIWFSRLDEILFCSLVVLFILVEESLLEVCVPDFVFGVGVGQPESLIKLVFVTQMLDDCVDQVHFQQHIDSSLRPKHLQPLLSQLTSLFIIPIHLTSPDRILPLPLIPVHIHSHMPSPPIDVMLLGLFHHAFGLQAVGDCQVGLF